MLKSCLHEIIAIDGVDGVLVITNRGVVASSAGIEMPANEAQALGEAILAMIAVYDKTGSKVSELEFFWDNRYIICKASPDFILITFCQTPKVLALLRITLNVSMANILEDKKFNKWLSAHTAGKGFILQKADLNEQEKNLLQKLK